MSAEYLMSPNPITAAAETRVADALAMLCEHRIHNLPVIDSSGHFIGLFGLRNLLKALLPKSATLVPALTRLDFLADDLQAVVQCLESVADQPVSDYVDRENLILCRADAPIMEVIRKLYQAPTSLPVVLVDKDGSRLVGMISNWDILTKLSAELFGTQTTLRDACAPGAEPEP